MKRCQRVVAPYADANEVVLDYDVGIANRTKVDLIATDRNLWVYPSIGGDLAKIPYASIQAARWFQVDRYDWVLEWNDKAGREMAVDIRAPRTLGASVVARISGRTDG